MERKNYREIYEEINCQCALRVWRVQERKIIKEKARHIQGLMARERKKYPKEEQKASVLYPRVSNQETTQPDSALD
jgi:hypothetical protein